MPERNVHGETVKSWRDGWAGRALDALWRRAHIETSGVRFEELHQGALVLDRAWPAAGP